MAKLGRLKSVGIEALWQVPLYCPVEYKDYSEHFENFNPQYLFEGGYGVFMGRLDKAPETKWTNKRPRTQFTLSDGFETVTFSIFGDTRNLTKDLKSGQKMSVAGTVARFSGRVFLNDAELVPSDLLGKIVPVYKGAAGKATPDTVRKIITEHFEQAIPEATAELRKVLLEHLPKSAIRTFVRCPSMTLEQVLLHVHKPPTIESGYEALAVMKRLANLLAADQLLLKAKQVGTLMAPPIIGMAPALLKENIPFTLTEEQEHQVSLAIEQLYTGKLFNGLLVGDVGTGKTVVYGLIAAYVASAGHKVAVMLPNQNLARQIHEELTEYFGFLGVGLVTGNQQSDLLGKRIIVGTTALLFRDIGQVALVVVDEQQKLATSQREQLRDTHTHLLEVSATPIPRTMAYALYGAVKVLELKKCHAEKTIHTRLYDSQSKRDLMGGIKRTIDSGQKVLIVCPKCEYDDEQDGDMITAQKLAKDFERFAPSKVVLSHSKLDSEQNVQAIKRIKNGSAQVLISTTVIEVGMTIPGLERIVIMDAARFGLQQLHQLRGRVARKGGVGYCDLYMPKEVKNPDTLERLNVMVEVSDGFEIARHDLRIRGTGDLSELGETQHGSLNTIIKNMKGDLEDLESILDEVNQLNQKAA